MVDVSNMVTISMSHIRKETVDLLYRQADDNNPEFPVVYRKSGHGYVVQVEDDYFVSGDGVKRSGCILNPVCKYRAVPDDLHACISMAYGDCFQWLCLDGDAPVHEELPVYEW